MDARLIREACGACDADHISLCDRVADGDVDLREMAVPALQSVAVLDHKRIAAQLREAGEDDLAAVDRVDFGIARGNVVPVPFLTTA